jgi:hypothetical protein
MKVKAAFTMLVSETGAEIVVEDRRSSLTLVRLQLSPEQFLSAMSRLSGVRCDGIVGDLSKIGKRMEVSSFTFPMPETSWKQQREVAKELALKLCPAGWTPDLYFTSQGSFFDDDKGGKNARSTMRRWVDVTPDNDVDDD